MEINITDIEDLKVYNKTEELREYLESAENVIIVGGIVTLVRRFANAPSEIVQTFTTLGEFQEFRDRVLAPNEG